MQAAPVDTRPAQAHNRDGGRGGQGAEAQHRQNRIWWRLRHRPRPPEDIGGAAVYKPGKEPMALVQAE